MTQTTRSIGDLIQLLHDGETFYLDAAQKVKAPVYRDLFERMARIKRTMANELERELDVHPVVGLPAPGAALVDRCEPTYTDKRVGVGKVVEKIYLTLLEETEDRILDDLRSQLLCSDSADVRAIVSRSLPAAQHAHDEMNFLKVRLAA